MIAKVIEDSISFAGDRLTTIEVNIHRFVLAELNTHRVFSRNSASSRAIPVRKQIERIRQEPALPVSFPAEQRGMQGGQELPADKVEQAREYWLDAADAAIERAERLHELGVHKSYVNRILEPYMYHRVIITATDWDGFWEQRCSPLAQPEIKLAADAMRTAYDQSEPELVTTWGWHLPYIDDTTAGEIVEATPPRLDSLVTMQKVSAARCARVSYLTHDGTRDYRKDLELFERLVSARPGHWSPLEHVATPDPAYTAPGNLRGWRQLRHDYEPNRQNRGHDVR